MEPKDCKSEEVEITPEMIEAGESALLNVPGVTYGAGHFHPNEVVTAVFRAMSREYNPCLDNVALERAAAALYAEMEALDPISERTWAGLLEGERHIYRKCVEVVLRAVAKPNTACAAGHHTGPR